MRRWRVPAGALVAAALLAAVAGAGATPRRGGADDGSAVAKARKTRALSVVALIDTGINPYNKDFRDRSALAYRHPSKYIPGYPKEAKPLRLSLGLPYEKALEKDADVWAGLLRNQLYWIPGTRIVGAISLGAGGKSCESPTRVPPVGALLQENCKEHVILDDSGHGTMTASRAAGRSHSLAPDARIVEIEGLGEASVRWAANQGWIDVQSNSWLSLVPPPVNDETPEAFGYAAERMFTLAASGNGSAYIAGGAPTPTYLLSTAPPGVVLVGGHDNGKMTLWAGAPAHVVADAYGGFTAIHTSSTDVRPDPIACCTSAAAPYAAGGAAAIIRHARMLLGDRRTGIEDGIVARGRKGLVAEGPLADGRFTLDELRAVFFHTAEARPGEGRDDGLVHWTGAPRAPDNLEYGPGGNPFCVGCTTTPASWAMIPEGAEPYPFVGYGAINPSSVGLAAEVLAGDAELPSRPQADAQYDADQTIRGHLYP